MQLLNWMIMKHLTLMLLFFGWAIPLSSNGPSDTGAIDTCLNLRVEQLDSNGCRLHWDAIASCKWYIVECRTMGGELLFTKRTRLTHFVDLSPKFECQYRYKVWANGSSVSGDVLYEDCGLVYTNCKA